MATLVGTSGWSYDDWYPRGLKPAERLAYYAKQFDTVEINTTFYDLPRETTFAKWKEQTPEGFKFCIKGSKYVSHDLLPRRNFAGVKKAVGNLTTRAACLGDRLGVFLWQLPPIKADLGRLENFLKMLTSDGGYDHVLEFRDASWFSSEVFDLAETYNVSVCSFSAPWFSTELFPGPVGYLRLHGEEELYGGSYSDDELEELAVRLEDSFSESGGYVFFNTTNGGAVANALTLRRLLDTEGVKVHVKCPGAPYSPNPCPFEGDVMVKDFMDWVACPRCGIAIILSEKQEASQPSQPSDPLPRCCWCGRATKRKSGLCWLCEHGPASSSKKSRISGFSLKLAVALRHPPRRTCRTPSDAEGTAAPCQWLVLRGRGDETALSASRRPSPSAELLVAAVGRSRSARFPAGLVTTRFAGTLLVGGQRLTPSARRCRV